MRAALVDRYDVECELGRGGMAFVYAARDLKNERPVAIKVMRPEIAAALGPERFLREIKIEQRLQHGHILPLLASDAIDELPYYVMPFVTGETLRHRLERENQLPVEEALDIAGQVAEALDYAHREGVIHRDIKPENILLAGDTAYVADFGIARAAGAAGGEWQSASGTSVWWTSSGVVVGTPGYMSPEQAGAAPQLDGRSDQFSLACVVYEMLAGERPYTGSSIQAIVAKMLSLPAPSVRVLRELVPGVLDKALRRGLAKSAADRFATCGDFVAALRREPPWVQRIVEYPGTRYAAAILTVATAATVVVKLAGGNMFGERGIKVDTTRYVIFPPEYQPGAVAAPGERQRLQNAFSRWSGLSVVDQPRLNEALGKDSVAGSQARASEIARHFGAGRFVRVSVSPAGDSLDVHAVLYDVTARGPPLADHAVRLFHNRRAADSTFAALADYLLFRGALPEDTRALSGTRSFPAQQSFALGQLALDTWNLVYADSAFAAAVKFDAAYAQANLWLALVRAWSGAEAARWQIAAEQALLGRERLTESERGMADAVVLQARGDIGRACPQWQFLTRREPLAYAAWYGYAQCLRSDSVVVPDRFSLSGWRFRGSYQQAVRGYQRAFELRPAILSGFRVGNYQELRVLLMTDAPRLVPGRAAPPDTSTFYARPMWVGDSLVLVPYRATISKGLIRPWDSRLVQSAVQHERMLFHDIAVTWVTAFPRSAQAMEALAVALEMLDLPASMDTLRRARTLAVTPDERMSTAAAEVWMQVKLGTPSSPWRLSQAKALADSILGDSSQAIRDSRTLVYLAALTGRARLAASLVHRVSREGQWVPPSFVSVPSLLVYGSLGGPLDSVRALAQEVDKVLTDPSLPRRDDLSFEWVVWTARFAALLEPFPPIERGQVKGDYLVDAIVSSTRGDTQSVRGTLDRLRQSRRAIPPVDLAIDALYPEAILFIRLHDDKGAIAWLDPKLNSLRQSAPGTFDSPPRPGALVNAMALRAELAARSGDVSNARRWAEAVSILWSDADDFLQPLVLRMRRLAGS
ncbi:MAG TPA: serine/threonine-protein kinase [Gemmatimonadales bacterium]|nr:serine/threonine-protein kinase [Gemmatimonadales bacterium]